MISSELKKMSVDEKLAAIEELWESLSDELADLPSPEWHESVLHQRKQEMDSGQARFLTIEELRNRYR